MNAVQTTCLVLILLSGCVDHPTHSGGDEAPTAVQSLGKNSQLPENQAALAGEGNPRRNTTLHLSDCTGLAMSLQMPTTAGFPFAAPRGWEPSTLGNADYYWLYAMTCSRITNSEGQVSRNAVFGWDAHTNVSSSGRNWTGNWDFLMRPLSIYTGQGGGEAIDWGDVPLSSNTSFFMPRGTSETFVLATPTARLTIQEQSIAGLGSSGNARELAHRWLLDPEEEHFADVSISRLGASYSFTGNVAVEGNHVLTQWPVKIGATIPTRSIDFFEQSSFVLAVRT
ncbi:MAG: hypothetical protein ACPHID_05425 [Thermoplasmatota archaeon]